MKYPQGSLTDQQVQETWFLLPEISLIYEVVLGENGYVHFKRDRQTIRTAGGELDLIGWPDMTFVTYHRPDGSELIDLDDLCDTYRASATLHRIMKVKSA